MNTEQLHGTWHQLRGAAKAQWGKFTEDDLLRIDGDVERLVGLVQERYGYARERAAKEVERFTKRRADLQR